MSNTEKPDAATEALFKEIDEEAKADYKKCSVVDTLGAVFDCYSKPFSSFVLMRS